MKSLVSVLLLCFVALAPARAQSIAGTWKGEATVKGQQVPLTLQLSGSPGSLKAALRNGPESSPATSVTLTGDHLVVTFNYFARTLDATLAKDSLTGSFGSTAANAVANRFPVRLTLASPQPATYAARPALDGDWEVAVKSVKGESAWQLHIEAKGGAVPSAVVQRIDGDTGSLFSEAGADAGAYRFSHFTAAGPALYSLRPQPDGTLLFSNLLNDKQTDLVGHRPAVARRENLPAPTDPTQQTTVKNPAEPFRFSFPDLTGKVVSNTDPQFDGKVVLVAIGGSWCPNCHDEAPFLVSLYKQFHGRGLEIVDLSFEEGEQLKNPERLHAFVARYGIPYTVLVAGEPDQLTEKITQFNDLNCWPTSFFIGRDGRVKVVHAGFAGPANPVAHEELKKDVTGLIEGLLAEPVPVQSARR